MNPKVFLDKNFSRTKSYFASNFWIPIFFDQNFMGQTNFMEICFVQKCFWTQYFFILIFLVAHCVCFNLNITREKTIKKDICTVNLYSNNHNPGVSKCLPSNILSAMIMIRQMSSFFLDFLRILRGEIC